MTALNIPKELLEYDKNSIREIKLISGEVACNIDSESPNLLVVEKGSLRVFKRSADGRMFTLYRVNSGECCGLTVSCILSNSKFPAIIEVEEDVVAYKISAKQVRSWLQSNLMWQTYIFQQLTNKFTQLTDLTDNLVFNNMDSRIGNLLCHRLGNCRVIYATHQCIANEVGTSREVVSRSLRFLESEGFIKLTRGKIEILDSTALKNYSTLQ